MSKMYWKIKIEPIKQAEYLYYPVKYFKDPETAVANAEENNPGMLVTCEGWEIS